jgi:hypothetical protein
MPRIYDSFSDPRDFCKRCFPNEETAIADYGDNLEERNQGPDNRGNCFGYDAEHPDYDGEDYACEVCHKRLTQQDN